MLKKVLGQAPFDVKLCEDIIIVPEREAKAVLLFENASEYDLPLSCSLTLDSSIRVDCLKFDAVLPAEGKTEKSLCFSLPKDTKIIGGIAVCELEIIDRILDSKVIYELEIKTEMAYKCCEVVNQAFLPSEDILFTRCGRFFANRDEIIALEIPTMEKSEIELSVTSGKIRNFADGQIIELDTGLNRLIFDMEEDGSFEFKNPVSGDKVLTRTLSPKYYI